MIKNSKVIGIVPWLLVLAWMALIFMFSAQPAAVSGPRSMNIAAFIIKIAEKAGIAAIGASGDPELVGIADHLLRKFTHAAVYLVLAVLLGIALRTNGVKGRKLYSLAMLICVFYAATDEFHQLFVPGRAGMVKDIMIDSLGGAAGLMIFRCWVKLVVRV